CLGIASGAAAGIEDVRSGRQVGEEPAIDIAHVVAQRALDEVLGVDVVPIVGQDVSFSRASLVNSAAHAEFFQVEVTLDFPQDVVVDDVNDNVLRKIERDLSSEEHTSEL